MKSSKFKIILKLIAADFAQMNTKINCSRFFTDWNCLIEGALMIKFDQKEWDYLWSVFVKLGRKLFSVLVCYSGWFAK